MKKTLSALVLLVILVALPMLSNATPYSPTSSLIQNFGYISENPVTAGTKLFDVQALDNGAKFIGNIYPTTSGNWAEIRLGTTGAFDLSSYDSFMLQIGNFNENPWAYSLYITGQTNGVDYLVQSAWSQINNGSTGTLALDLTGLNVDLTKVTGIGFNIGAIVPLPGQDYTFETVAAPVPEPGTIMLLGAGLVGVGLYIRRKRA
ncbi:PEP-CTERM sorting domain-containing protein [Geobacter sulfurreducens]|uniref:PEP-CTERM sorting domain-containing protein n=1 Tax=Geobacter sulfurreducens TaxID=35554 RepID=UPI000DBB9F94|nr:PEP-CTERM sorting domain-containing protein [Geobacter sulfurreducens]BBA70488.1 hypothetical protein YM18_1968 [Geobacter sulfurreducens]